MDEPISPDAVPPARPPDRRARREQLVVAATLVRALPQLACRLTLPCGHRVVVADHPSHAPTLGIDSFVRLVRLSRLDPRAQGDGPGPCGQAQVPGLRWLDAVLDVRLAGSGLSDRGAGLLRLPDGAGERLAFATLLSVARAREVLEHAVPDDGGRFDEVVLSLRPVPALDTVVVTTAVGGPAHAAALEGAMASALAACLVEELVADHERARRP